MKIPTVKIEFKNLSDFILEESEYKKYGSFAKFCSENSIQIKEVKKVHHILMKSEDYPTIEWQG